MYVCEIFGVNGPSEDISEKDWFLKSGLHVDNMSGIDFNKYHPDHSKALFKWGMNRVWDNILTILIKENLRWLNTFDVMEMKELKELEHWITMLVIQMKMRRDTI